MTHDTNLLDPQDDHGHTKEEQEGRHGEVVTIPESSLEGTAANDPPDTGGTAADPSPEWWMPADLGDELALPAANDLPPGDDGSPTGAGDFSIVSAARRPAAHYHAAGTYTLSQWPSRIEEDADDYAHFWLFDRLEILSVTPSACRRINRILRETLADLGKDHDRVFRSFRRRRSVRRLAARLHRDRAWVRALLDEAVAKVAAALPPEIDGGFTRRPSRD